jgi:hypothetical protein
MLEPAVRPGAAGPASGAQAGTPAFENSSFDQLLARVGTQEAQGDEATEGSEQRAGVLDPLGGLGRIENAALRGMLAKQGGADGSTGSTESTSRHQ